MENWLRQYDAAEVEAALGDKPFVVRGLWPGEQDAEPPPPSPPTPTRAAPLSADRPGGPARGDPAQPRSDIGLDAAEPRGGSRRRWPRPRRWPLVTFLAGTALSAACMAVWLVPPASPPRAAVPRGPSEIPFAAAQPTPLYGHSSELVQVLHPALPAAEEAPRHETSPTPPLPAPELDAAPVAEQAVEPTASVPPTAALVPTDAQPVHDAEPRRRDPTLAAALLQRGEAALARKDIAAARAYFVRASSVDPLSVEALLGAGKTYDPGFLQLLGVTGGLADPEQARLWYGQAAWLGDSSAKALAQRLGAGP